MWEWFNRSFGTGRFSRTVPPSKGWAIFESPYGRCRTNLPPRLSNRRLKSPEGSSRRRGESSREAGLFAVGGAEVDHAALGGLVERGAELAVSGIGVLLLATFDRFFVIALQLLEAGLDAPVVQTFALAVAHAAFGGPGVRHIRR